MTPISKYAFYVVLLVLFFVPGCKEKHQTPTPSNPSINFSLSKHRVVPLEVIQLSFIDKYEKDLSLVKFGDSQIPVVKVGDSTYVLTIPENAVAGANKVTMDGNSWTETLVVDKLPEMKEPKIYVNDFKVELDTIVSQVTGRIENLVQQKYISPTQGDSILGRISLAINKFNGMLTSNSEVDNLTLARYLFANKDKIDLIFQNFAEQNQRFSGARVMNDCNESLPDNELFACIFYRGFKAGGTAGMGLLLLGAAAVTITAPVALAVIGAVVAVSLVDYYGALYQISINKLIKLGEVLSLNGLRTLNFEFQNGKAKKMQLSIPVRNFQEDLDLNSPNPDVNSFARQLKGLRKMSVLIKSDIDIKIPSFPLEKGYTYPDDLSKFRIDIVGDPEIAAEVPQLDEQSFDLVFTTKKSGRTIFDFVINYEYMGEQLSQTITDNTLVNNSMAIFEGGSERGILLDLPGAVATPTTSMICHTKKIFLNSKITISFEGSSFINVVDSRLTGTIGTYNINNPCTNPIPYYTTPYSFSMNSFTVLGKTVNIDFKGSDADASLWNVSFEGEIVDKKISGKITFRRTEASGIHNSYTYPLDVQLSLRE
ncbi:hypothetical protein [Dyadobacter sp. CY343]|uniref:hypothetical protein n=1 Tax=Dyadobacter sp. CY343 TaxID=2907299 RepID=UPI001F3F7F9F|nr:hypothetical protein [Dyadobacter sp. CY343]MCE7061974.1 hypothetical protein [Dyadobacter sp. CY343]